MKTAALYSWTATVCAERMGRMILYRCGTLLACGTLLWSVSFASLASDAMPAKAGQEPNNKVRILLLVDASTPLTVHYRTLGKVAATNFSMLVPVAKLIEWRESSKIDAEDSLAFRNMVGTFDRRPVIEAGIAATFRETSRYFEAVAPQDPSLYMKGTSVDFHRAQVDGYPYVLDVREEFAGLATAFKMATLSAGSALQFTLSDTATGRQFAKGKSNLYSLQQHPFDVATTDRSVFLQDYPVVIASECAQIYGDLSRKGQLNAMAEAHGLGKEVPDMGALLAKYAKLFDYEFTLPKGWHQVAGASKYQTFMEPKSDDRSAFGVSFNIDLLIEEFGQNVQDIDGYARIMLDRLREKGYAVDSAKPFNGFTLNAPYTAFVVDRPNGAGKELILLRRVDDVFVAFYAIVFLRDYDDLLTKYTPDLQLLINQAKISTHPRVS